MASTTITTTRSSFSAATGLGTPFLRRFAFAVATSTLLGSVCLHGLGRCHDGVQWRAVLPLADTVARLRMAAGFDLTLLLSVLNCVSSASPCGG